MSSRAVDARGRAAESINIRGYIRALPLFAIYHYRFHRYVRNTRTNMRIHNLVPILCVGGAYALPTLSWLPQFPVEGLVRCWGIFAPLSEDRTIYQVLKDDERSLV